MTAVARLPNADAEALVALARSRTVDDRQRLLMGIVALCDSQPDGVAMPPVLADIFMTLVAQAERDIRRALSERLAKAVWAPLALINVLALDEIEIARPVIAASPLLRDQDLLRILVEATIEHQIAVASRPGLSGRVADAVIDAAQPGPMTALAGNETAELGEPALRRLVEHSRRIAGLRAPLARHPALSEALANQLGQWVGEAVKQAIAERFRIASPALDQAIHAAVSDVAGAWRHSPAPSRVDDAEQDETERRLVAKLQAANQLRPGFLVRALREGRLSLFEQALAAQIEAPLAHIRAAARAASPQALFLACASLGVDRAVFAAMLKDIRKLGDGHPSGDVDYSQTPATTEAAAIAFREMIGQTIHAV